MARQNYSKEFNARVALDALKGQKTQLDAAGSISHSEALQKPVQIPAMLKMFMGMMRR